MVVDDVLQAIVVGWLLFNASRAITGDAVVPKWFFWWGAVTFAGLFGTRLL